MGTLTDSATTDLAHQPVTVYYLDGRILDAVLSSHTLTQCTVRLVPQIPVNDRRRQLRAPYFSDVHIGTLGVRLATDISSGGIYISCITPSPVGTIMPVSLVLGTEVIRLDARVAFIDPGIGMGLEFHRVPSTVRLKLEALAEQIIKTEGSMLQKTRRTGRDRRSPNSRTKNLRIKRYTADRRSTVAAAPPESVEASLSDIKYIFFKGGLAFSSSKGPDAFIEFHDGENLRAKPFDFPHNSQGFFAEYRVSDDTSYVLFFVQSALSNVRCQA